MHRGGFTGGVPHEAARGALLASALALGALVLVALAACGGSKPAKHPEPPPEDVTYPAGTLSAPANDAEKVLRAMRGQIRRCYEDALKNDPKAEGVVKMQIKVDPDGEVTAAKPVGDTSLPSGVVGCISGLLKTAKFASPGPGGATFELPLSFTRREE
jgi:hypothetical protein